MKGLDFNVFVGTKKLIRAIGQGQNLAMVILTLFLALAKPQADMAREDHCLRHDVSTNQPNTTSDDGLARVKNKSGRQEGGYERA